MDIRGLAPSFTRYASLLRPERREKMMSYRSAGDRLRCLAGGLLVDYIACGQEIRYTEYGKPFLPEGPHFSLSHSGNFACLAVSASSPVGIDIEKQRPEDFAALGKTAFHPAELASLQRESGEERFFDLWTRKESYVKMTGAGFSIEPSSFCVLPEEPVLPFPGTPFFRNFNVIPGYSLALCAEEPVRPLIKRLFFTSGSPETETLPAAVR
jgi:4'-phosphopantetheinyl transferase